MSWFSGIFANLLGQASTIVDEVVTSNEERLTLQNQLQDIIVKSEADAQEAITRRWEADLQSDSWLAKNVRPMVLLFLVTCTMILVFIDAGWIQFEVEDKWTDLLQIVLITVIGAYFGGRSFEKADLRSRRQKRKDKQLKEDLNG